MEGLKNAGVAKAQVKTKTVKELNPSVLRTTQTNMDLLGAGTFENWLKKRGNDKVPAPIPTYMDAAKNWGGQAGKWPDDAKE